MKPKTVQMKASEQVRSIPPMRKGFVQLLPFIVLFAIVGAFVYISAYGIPALPSGELLSCQNIYAYYPAFTCCTNDVPLQGTKTLYYSFTDGATQKWQCPTTSHECKVKATYNTGTVYTGRLNCAGSAIGNVFGCSDGTPMSSGSTYTIQPGSWVYYPQTVQITLNYEVNNLKLCACGDNPCGLPCGKVSGSDGCGFNLDGGVYDGTGRIKQNANPLATYAYTVPFGDCYSWYPSNQVNIIGNTCDACDSTADCASRYSLKYTYNGKQYGAVCDGSNVQLYDCVNTGSNACVSWRQDKDGNNVECLQYGKMSRCDMFLAVPVQCCPGTSSCGSGSFCDATTYTCKATAGCVKNSDCGINVQCDYTTRKQKTPVCNLGSCTFSETPVDCCIDSNCPSNYYCGADYKCYEKTAAKVVCPYQCCAGSEQFFDKGCATGTVCCSGNSPSATCAASCGGGDGECNSAASCAAGDLVCAVTAPIADLWCSFLKVLLPMLAKAVIALVITAVICVILFALPWTRFIFQIPWIALIIGVILWIVILAVIL